VPGISDSGILDSGVDSGTGSTAVDTNQTTTYRALKAVVIILGVLIVVAIGTLVVGLFVRFNGHKRATASDAPVIFTLAPGARLMSSELDASRLVLHVRTHAGDELDIIDTETGRLVVQVKPSAEPPHK